MKVEGLAHYKIIVEGRVQGVGYRAFASRAARSLNLKGYVKNQFDGTVLIEVEGQREVLDKFVLSCKAGPGWAHINKVNLIETPIEGYQNFNVKY